MRTYAALDARCRQLIFIVKHWAKVSIASVLPGATQPCGICLAVHEQNVPTHDEAVTLASCRRSCWCSGTLAAAAVTLAVLLLMLVDNEVHVKVRTCFWCEQLMYNVQR